MKKVKKDDELGISLVDTGRSKSNKPNVSNVPKSDPTNYTVYKKYENVGQQYRYINGGR